MCTHILNVNTYSPNVQLCIHIRQVHALKEILAARDGKGVLLSSHSSKCKPGVVMRRQMAKMVVDRITSSEDATAQSGSQPHMRNLTINSPDKLEWNEQNRQDAYALISL